MRARKACYADAKSKSRRPAEIEKISPFAASGLSGVGRLELYAVADNFRPIYTGTFSQSSYDVAEKLRNVPTLTELTARLGALPREALAAAVAAEPEIYKRTIGDAKASADYFRLLAAGFDEISARLASVS